MQNECQKCTFYIHFVGAQLSNLNLLSLQKSVASTIVQLHFFKKNKQKNCAASSKLHKLKSFLDNKSNRSLRSSALSLESTKVVATYVTYSNIMFRKTTKTEE